MSSIAPDARPEVVTKRPRYLVVALVAALVFAAECWTSGCARLQFYRGETVPDVNSAIHDEAARTRADALFQHFLDTAAAARRRELPFAAGTFVLGAALLVLAARALAGRSNTRSALVQVVAVQAIVVASAYYVNRDVREAELDWQFDAQIAKQREVLPEASMREQIPVLLAVRRWAPPGWLVFRSFACCLILVALTRRRTRDFFEAAGRDTQAAER